MTEEKKNFMYDPLEDELHQITDFSDSHVRKFVKAIRLEDEINLLPYRDFITAGPGDKLRTVVNSIKNHHQGCIIIIENERLKGIFTERDILMKIVGRPVDLDKEVVKDYMTKNPQWLRSTDPIAFALNRMTDGGYRHVPILDEQKKPIGLVCMKTIVNYIAEYFHEEIMNLPPRPQRTSKRREDA